MLKELVRRTPQGRLDISRTFGNIVGEPHSDKELIPETYLQTLNKKDVTHVVGFLDFVRTLRDVIPGVRIAVTAVGSTTQPEAERHHPAEDIDLRVLNSAPKGTPERVEVVKVIQEKVTGFLNNNGINFKEADHTTLNRRVWSYSGNQKELVPYVDWYNNDPSVIATYDVGLPLHISISGVGNPDLDTYLKKERRHNGRFSLLHNSPLLD